MACGVKTIKHCNTVPDIVKERKVAYFSLKEAQKRKQRLGASVVEEAAVTGAAEYARI